MNNIFYFLQENKTNENIKKSTEALFDLCKKYYHLYLIHNNIDDSSRRVLESYIDPALYKRNYKSKNYRIKLNIEEKLYVDLFTKVFIKYNDSDYKWQTVIYNEKLITELLKKSNVPENLYTLITNLVCTQYENTPKKLDISRIDKAMEVLKESLNIPKPTLEESVTAVISNDKLNELYDYLKAGNIAGFYFLIAPIRRALYDGEYHKYTKAKSNTQKIFNLTSNYNYIEYERYIFSTVENDGKAGLVDLLHTYEDVKEEINTWIN